ncbi:DUF2508 family protein [Virgibacillus halodenitrificans]|nr:DUF2508 family protein [Virgibacillus halodenitrificans]
MGRKIKKYDVDRQLLDAFYEIENEWKQIESFMGRSFEANQAGRQQETLARAKYLFLLREARHRNVSAKWYK